MTAPGPTGPIRVLELRSVWGTGGGPEKTILRGAAKSDPSQFAVTVCYIRDERDPVFGIDRRAGDLDIDYVEIRERHSFDWKIWPALRKLVRDRRIDIVHAHDYKTDLLALLLRTAEGVVPLSTAHGWAGVSRRERAYYFFDKRLLARFPLVIAVSSVIRDTLLRAGAQPERVRRIRNGIEPDRFRRTGKPRDIVRSRMALPAGAPLLGSVGRLEAEKRFDVLVDAVARLHARGAALVLAGDGSCRQALQNQAARLGLADRVCLPGHEDDIRPVYESLDVYVQSSDTEGISNAVLEAMALEVPIVATDVGGTNELIDDGVHGLLIPRRDPEAMARAVERTIDDVGATRRRVAAARARVEGELSFDARLRAVEAIYAGLLPGRTRKAQRG